MKRIIFCITFILATTLSYSQYDITWKVSDSCTPFASGDGLRGEKDMTKIEQNKEIELIIEIEKEKISSLFVRTEAGDSVNVIKQVSTIDGVDSKVEIKPQGSMDLRMIIGEDTHSIAYPYEITLSLKNGQKCKIVIGKKGTNKDTFPKVNVNLLGSLKPDIQTNLSSLTGAGENALIILDCSAMLSAKSSVIRFNRKGNQKKVKYLRYGDQVGICLINFNHYKFSAILEEKQVDFEYNQGQALFDLPQDTSKKASEAAGTGGGESSKSAKVRLLEYAEAVKQMEEFIKYIKSNPNPNSEILEENKTMILDKIDELKIGTGADITSMYETLSETDRGIYKDVYENALQFNQKRSEIRSLTYTIKANITPIKIKSYDKLAFDLTIKDKGNSNVLEKRNYEYLIIGGWQINQSFGVAGHTLYDEELGLLPTPAKDTVFATQNGIRIPVLDANGVLVDSISAIKDVEKQTIIEDPSSNKVSLSATTLTHLYYRGGRWGLGPALGVGVDFFPKANIRYLAGGSLMFMDGRFRISLDVGCVFGKISVLAANQKVGDILEPEATSPNMVEKSARSLYFGLSWNIPLTPKEKQKLE